MKRRKALSVLASGVAIPLAGCLSGEVLPGGTDEPSGGSTITEVENYIDRATERLAEETALSFTRSPRVSIQTSEIALTLDNAQTAIDRVANNPDTDSSVEIQAYRTYVTALKELTTELKRVEEALNTISAAQAYRETERYENATEEIRAAEELLIAALEIISATQTRLEEVNTNLIDTSAVNRTGIRELYGNLSALIDTYQRYAHATYPYYEGLGVYWAGVEAYNRMEYQEVDVTFVEASGRFDTARSRYRSAESAVPASAREVFIEQTCVAESMRESSEQFIEAAIDSQNGEVEQADDHVKQGIDARDQDCSTQ
ncbi:hypothetical protein [Halorubrum distributum]|uniref:hypothetical protein n=1 Tax=Halorubrum distributum TaxID=29283 RepID=UPI00067800B3|nr:hypothetical protein [Halorubrum arcis]